MVKTEGPVVIISNEKKSAWFFLHFGKMRVGRIRAPTNQFGLALHEFERSEWDSINLMPTSLSLACTAGNCSDIYCAYVP